MDFCQLPDPYPDAHSLPLLNRTGEENKISSWVKMKTGRSLTNDNRAKLSLLGENQFNLLAIKIELDGEKLRQMLKYFFPITPYPQALFHSQLLHLHPQVT